MNRRINRRIDFSQHSFHALLSHGSSTIIHNCKKRLLISLMFSILYSYTHNIYIYILYTYTPKKCVHFWGHVFFQTKNPSLGWFFCSPFPLQLLTHEGAGPATGSQTAWNRADGAVVGPVGWAFQPRGPLFLLTLVGCCFCWPTWITWISRQLSWSRISFFQFYCLTLIF